LSTDNVVDPQDVQSFRLAQRKAHAGPRIEAELVVAVVEAGDEAELEVSLPGHVIKSRSDLSEEVRPVRTPDADAKRGVHPQDVCFQFLPPRSKRVRIDEGKVEISQVLEGSFESP
jgi:hypothetical protein